MNFSEIDIWVPAAFCYVTSPPFIWCNKVQTVKWWVIVPSCKYRKLYQHFCISPRSISRLVSVMEADCVLCEVRTEFLGVFAKFRKATVIFVMSVCLSVWYNSAPTRRIFLKFDIWGFFGNLPGKFKIRDNPTRITGNLPKEMCTFGNIHLNSS
jgi:hypothetical protein